MFGSTTFDHMLRGSMSLASPGGPKGRLSILIYHRVLDRPDPLFPDEPDLERFDEMMGWVAKWFNVLPLSQAVAHLRNGTLPPRAAAITFDDGYADNLTNAVPILKRHGLVATFFIATDFLDGGRMWNDTLIEAIRLTKRPSIQTGLPDLASVAVRTTQEKRNAIAQLLPKIKHMSPHIRERAVSNIAVAAEAELPEDLMLTCEQLRVLASSGMEVGAHTASHPILAAMELGAAKADIEAGKARLEEIVGRNVDIFAYPNGRPGQDYNKEHTELIRNLGFSAAVSTQWGSNGKNADHFQLARFTPWDRSQFKFALRLLKNLRVDGCAGVA